MVSRLHQHNIGYTADGFYRYWRHGLNMVQQIAQYSNIGHWWSCMVWVGQPYL